MSYQRPDHTATPAATPAATSAANPWESLDQALSRLESAILTQKHNNAEDGVQGEERLRQQNTHLRDVLQQTLADLKSILKG